MGFPLCPLRFKLWREVGVFAGNAVLIRTAIDFRFLGEISVRRWSRCGPFESRCIPGIIGCDFLATPDAPEEIDDEENLCDSKQPRGPGDVNTDGLNSFAVHVNRLIVKPAR